MPSINRLFLFILASAAVSACTSTNTAHRIDHAQHYQQALAQLTHWEMDGKAAISRNGQSSSGLIRWKQQGDHFEIFISGPLGTGSTHIYGDNTSLTLENGEQHFFAQESPEQVLNQQLGWSLPLDKLPQWIIGRTDAHTRTFNEDNTLSSFSTHGWQVHYAKHQWIAPWWLPKKMTLSNDHTRVTLIIQKWRRI